LDNNLNSFADVRFDKNFYSCYEQPIISSYTYKLLFILLYIFLKIHKNSQKLNIKKRKIIIKGSIKIIKK